MLNQLRYKQLRMHLPVKRVETETVITHVSIGRGQPGQIHLSAGPGQQSRRETRHSRTYVALGEDNREPGQIHLLVGPGRQPTGKHVNPCPQSPVTGTGRSDTCVDMWR